MRDVACAYLKKRNENDLMQQFTVVSGTDSNTQTHSNTPLDCCTTRQNKLLKN
jgi:hypothetical protein